MKKSIYMAYDILNNQLDYFVNNGGSNFVEKYKDDKYEVGHQ